MDLIGLNIIICGRESQDFFMNTKTSLWLARNSCNFVSIIGYVRMNNHVLECHLNGAWGSGSAKMYRNTSLLNGWSIG